MKRKVIQMAGKTMVISIPADWVKKYGIKKGEELEIEERGTEIVISTSKSHDLEEIKIDLQGHDRFIRRNLNTLYRKGYDKIEFIYDNPKIADEIQKAIDESMLGFEMLSQTEKDCVIRAIAHPDESEFDATLRRLFLIVLSMSKDSLIAILDNDYTEVEKIMEKEVATDRIANYCQRLLNKRGYKDFKKITSLYVVIKSLERVADEYKNLCAYVVKNKLKLSKSTLLFYSKTNKIFEFVYNMYYQFDNRKLIEEKKQRVALKEEFNANITKVNGKEAAVYHYLMTVVDESHHMTENWL